MASFSVSLTPNCCVELFNAGVNTIKCLFTVARRKKKTVYSHFLYPVIIYRQLNYRESFNVYNKEALSTMKTHVLLANIEPSLTMQCFSVFIALHKVISNQVSYGTCCHPSTPSHCRYKPLFTLVPIPDLVLIN